MKRTFWLASFPKSGNTWLRMLINALALGPDRALDINALPERGGIASARQPFERLTLLDSDLLTPDEADCLRPRIYEQLAEEAGEPDDDAGALAARFVKAHDAYTLTPKWRAAARGRARRGRRGAHRPRSARGRSLARQSYGDDHRSGDRRDERPRLLLLRRREAAIQPVPTTAARLERACRELARSARCAAAPSALRGPLGRCERRSRAPARFHRTGLLGARDRARRGRRRLFEAAAPGARAWFRRGAAAWRRSVFSARPGGTPGGRS